MSAVPFEIRLVHQYELAEGVLHLVFERVDAQPFSFIAGQFITLLWTDPVTQAITRRSYSLAMPPGSPYLEIAVSYVPGGKASEILFHLNIGDVLTATGPYGRLILPADLSAHPRLILIGTGTGITPYRAMRPQLLQYAQQHGSVVVLMGARTRSQLLYESEWLEASAAAERFVFQAALSRLNDADQPSFIQKGYVQHQLSSLNVVPNQDLFYLCGNPQMIDETYALLLAQGAESRTIKREKYISS